jgi:hypothetical protein
MPIWKHMSFWIWVAFTLASFAGLAFNLTWEGSTTICNRSQETVVCANQLSRAFGPPRIKSSLYGIAGARALPSKKQAGSTGLWLANSAGQEMEIYAHSDSEEIEAMRIGIQALIDGTSKDPVTSEPPRAPGFIAFAVLFGACVLAPLFRRRKRAAPLSSPDPDAPE